MFEERDMVKINTEEVKEWRRLLVEAQDRLERERKKIYYENNTWYNFIMYYLGWPLHDYQ